MTNREILLSILFIAALQLPVLGFVSCTPPSICGITGTPASRCYPKASLFASFRRTVKKHVFTLSVIQSASKVGSVTFHTAILLKWEQNQANKHMLSLLYAMKGLLVCLNSRFLLATSSSCTHRFHQLSIWHAETYRIRKTAFFSAWQSTTINTVQEVQLKGGKKSLKSGLVRYFTF